MIKFMYTHRENWSDFEPSLTGTQSGINANKPVFDTYKHKLKRHKQYFCMEFSTNSIKLSVRFFYWIDTEF